MDKMVKVWTLMLAAATLVYVVSCDGQMMIASHMTTLVITCGMLWSTLNLDKHA